MLEFQSTINNKIGMHLRAAGEFVKVANKYSSSITVFMNGKKADGKSILGLASLAIGRGATITIRINGKDEADAQKALQHLIKKNFFEDE